MSQTLERNGIISLLSVALLSLLSLRSSLAGSAPLSPYVAVDGLIDLRSNYSDGAHSIEDLVKMADSRGFRVLFINDHDRIALSYGIPPFRRILRYRKEFPSIMTHGPEKFLEEINRISKKYPHMTIIPGSITSAYYYWTGSWLKGTLTLHEYDRRMLIVNFDKAKDYAGLPNLHNRASLRYTKALLPGLVVFVVPFLLGAILIRWKGLFRVSGLILMVLSALAIVDYNPFRSSFFSPYEGDQGIAPFQELIYYTAQRGGLSFWNYPEQKSGVRKFGPIHVSTPPYPQVLYESRDYTGFAAIYGENVTVTNPGKEWDRVLMEYCRGQREQPPWGISTADFHKDGPSVRRLGAYPTTFLVREVSKEAVLEAMEKGRMYCSLNDGKAWPRLDYFNVLGNEGERAFMGQSLKTSNFPIIKFRVSYRGGRPRPISILLIRGGELVDIFSGMTPLQIEYIDERVPADEKTYYRLIDEKKHLTSNPIFVNYNPKGS